jgi:hypothetical protein
MNCCGSKRQPLPVVPAQPPAEGGAEPGYVAYRYTGRYGLTVVGGGTGRTYRFAAPGAEVLIDRRDAPGMYAVPNVVALGS